jgi:hypothetical protein
MSDRSSSPAPVDASALEQVIREIEDKFFVAGQMDAQGHAAEKWHVGSGGPVLALSKRLLADARERLAMLAAPRAPLEPREELIEITEAEAQAWRDGERAAEPERSQRCRRAPDCWVYVTDVRMEGYCQECYRLVLRKTLQHATRPRPALPQEPQRQIMVDRDAGLRIELRAYLDTLTITGDNIGDIRRSLFMPWDSPWNGWVRDETAERENLKAARPALP